MLLQGATVALSAFLLFAVQPIVARQILPWFGGSAGVWTTSMVFFQAGLLAGYGYAHALTQRLTLGRQAMVHTALLCASLASLPIIPSERFRPTDASHPAGRILLLLLATVGLPYFLLSTTGPLVQAWFARSFPGGKVYRLYALSNLASLAALASYPLLVEPHLSGRWQSVGWSLGYALFTALAAAAAWRAVRRGGEGPVAGAAALPGAPRSEAAPPRPWMWFLLAMLGSTLLLSVTAHLTQDVASVPFLWVLPLAIYLLTFILCFEGKRWYRRGWCVPLAGLLAVAMLGGLTFGLTGWAIEPGILHARLALPLYLVGLFVLCMFSHGELAARRPAPQDLTRFYLMVALGGVAGGLFVGMVAPLAFATRLELPIALCAVALLAWLAVPGRLRLVGAAALVACACLVTFQVLLRLSNAVRTSRNFYGTLAVTRTAPDGDPEARWRLMDGVILHGEQYRRPELRCVPTTYFGETSGVGRAIRALRPGRLRVGVVGLGVGTLAAYGQTGDVFRFYELNPQVLREAQRSFSYLQDSAALVEVVLGDGRLGLEREAPQLFDLLVIDAFSSDAIPVHLLTQQALRLYARHVRARGAIAFNVTNRYLDLDPVVRRLADDAGLQAWAVHDRPRTGSRWMYSNWVLVTGDDVLLARLRTSGIGGPIPLRPGLRPWTDDFSDLLRALKLGEEDPQP